MESLRPAIAALRLSASRQVSRPSHPQQSYRCLHASATRCATPLPHPSVPGPPPETPSPSASDALHRVARKQKQAEMLKQAKEIRSPSAKTKTVLQKRFWKDVSIKETPEGLQIFLDARPVRTPTKEILTIPSSKPQLAAAIALEWDLLVSAQQALKTHLIPLTSLTSRARDIQIADAEGDNKIRQAIITVMMRYLSTDTLLCWAPENVQNELPQDGLTLRQTQMKLSAPIIAELTTKVWPGVEIKPILEPDSFMPVPQPDNTQSVIRGWMSGLPAYELAGLERAVLASKSLLVGARLVHEWSETFAMSRADAGASAERFGIEEAAAASSTEVRWQTRQWGEVDDTHDVEKEDMRRQLGSVVLLVSGTA
ncbi:unnamed protein product [Periconia digitata]|uniref:ATP synthase mitochondrial F1 complex assembly factor 2 n=1 Tax=Periconia digitata TaxID=1303443 RepID=A0A9W4XM33_9PLEO|nr:unnamed protein product [Periconia digitata]